MKKQFNRIYIEIHDYCNLSCDFCTSRRKNENKMTLDEFKIIIEQIKDYTNNIYLHVLGEPLLHENVFEFIEYASKYLNVYLTTNGFLIKKNYEKLINSNIKKINISLNSSYILDDDSQMKYLIDIFEFINDKLSKNNDISFNLRLWGSCDFEANRVIKKLEKIYSQKIDVKKNVKILNRVILSLNNKFSWGSEEGEYNEFKRCLGTIDHVAILSNKEVVACCIDDLGLSSFGNILKDSFKNIIESEKFINTKKSFENNKAYLNVCKRCSFDYKKK